MQFDWRTSIDATALYAVLAVLDGRMLVEPAVAAAIGALARQLADDLGRRGCPAPVLLRHLIPLVGEPAGEGRLAVAGLDRLDGPRGGNELDALVARSIVGLRAALLAARPRLAQELPLRVEPLRLQWEARGPGLLAAIGRLAGPDLFVQRARVTLVQPVTGGGGLAHPASGGLTFEAMLANPVSRLPEILRLAWLAAQLRPDESEPVLAGQAEADRANILNRLALVPLVLAAASDVELASYDQELLALVLATWLDRSDFAPALAEWWETVCDTRTSWPAAVAALQSVLPLPP